MLMLVWTDRHGAGLMRVCKDRNTAWARLNEMKRRGILCELREGNQRIGAVQAVPSETKRGRTQYAMWMER